MLTIKYLSKNNRRITRRTPSVVIVAFILLMSILIFSPNSTAVEVQVTLTIDEHEIEYFFIPNSSLTIKVSGNVTCEFEGWGVEVQYIEINLYASSELEWSVGVGPSYLTFYENGQEPFIVYIEVPDYVYNQTENLIRVSGYYQTQPIVSEPLGGHGTAGMEMLFIKINRTIFPQSHIEFSELWPEPGDFIETFGWPYVITVTSIPIIIAISIIYLFYRRHKKIKKLLAEYEEKNNSL